MTGGNGESLRDLEPNPPRLRKPPRAHNHDHPLLLSYPTSMDWDSLTPQRLQVLEQLKKRVQEEQLLKDEQQLVLFDDFSLA